MKDLILIIVSILWCIPILISFVISGLREKLESDRNFYGKEISPKDIELVRSVIRRQSLTMLNRR